MKNPASSAVNSTSGLAKHSQGFCVRASRLGNGMAVCIAAMRGCFSDSPVGEGSSLVYKMAPEVAGRQILRSAAPIFSTSRAILCTADAILQTARGILQTARAILCAGEGIFRSMFDILANYSALRRGVLELVPAVTQATCRAEPVASRGRCHDSFVTSRGGARRRQVAAVHGAFRSRALPLAGTEEHDTAQAFAVVPV